MRQEKAIKANASIDFDLEEMLKSVRDTAEVATSAVTSLCDVVNGRFWRDTGHRELVQSSDPERRFPTASLCSAQALLSLVLEQPDWCTGANASVARQFSANLVRSFDYDALAESSLVEGDAEPATFTLAQLMHALSTLARLDGDVSRLFDILDKALDDHRSPFTPAQKGPRAHPFVLYHTARALEGALAQSLDGRRGKVQKLLDVIYERLEAISIALIADYRSGRSNPADVVAMAFCGAGLAQDSGGRNDEYCLAALEAAIEGQETSGCWALGRLIRRDRSSPENEALEIEISTYEIASVIADSLLLLASRSDVTSGISEMYPLVRQLSLAASFATRSVVLLPRGYPEPRRGWCCDHPFNDPIVESWTSATVLRFCLSFEALLTTLVSEQALAEHSVRRPSDPGWPGWLRWTEFRNTGEMDHEAQILSYLDSELVQPIARSVRGLPSASDGTVSALLFGPPGTSKTTIVRGVADGLGWPIVELSPGVFIEKGLELIEAQARQVFESLYKLERCVVMFDECDELFRERGPTASSEQIRSITAFVTASMLPKLQRLHDEGRVVFFICTNNFETLDPAIKRRGRIDHILGVGPPDEAARRAIITSEAMRLGLSDDHLCERLWSGTERFSRGELIQLARDLEREVARSSRSADVETMAARLVRDAQGGLNISPEVYQEFLDSLRASSFAHIRSSR